MSNKPTFSEEEINVADLRLNFKLWHRESGGSAIIFLHGWLDNASSFDLLAPLVNLSPIYAIDLPGHGLSEHLSKSSHYHFIDGVTHLCLLIKALQLKHCVLVGHSLGACLASIAAGILGPQVTKLVLLDGIGPLTSLAGKSAARLSNYLLKLNTLSRKPKRYYQSVDEAIQARASRGYLSFELAKHIVKRGVKRSEQGFFWRHDNRLLLPSSLRMTEAQVLSFLKEIDCPTCLITATMGFQYDRQLIEGRMSVVKDLKEHKVNLGHHLHLEAPKVIANIINEFLAS